MIWRASLEIKREDGTLHVLSATDRQLRYKKIRTPDPVYDEGQFAFLQGNEECAREWQEAQMVFRKIK